MKVINKKIIMYSIKNYVLEGKKSIGVILIFILLYLIFYNILFNSVIYLNIGHLFDLKKCNLYRFSFDIIDKISFLLL